MQKPLYKQEISPWLDLTCWASYLSGHPLVEVAALAALPSPETEPLLHEFGRSLERLTNDAYQSICSDAINPFDQTRINSFLPEPRLGTRPLMVKLQKGTWRKYISVWRALLCFVYRTADAGCPIALEHRLTSRQATCLESALKQARALCEARSNDVATANSHSAVVAIEEAADQLDRTCLDLCIALLDHDLKGPIYQSVVVGFLAVLGIDAAKDTLREAYCYSPMLAGFIKIARLLVIQKAVIATEAEPGSYAAEFLEEMRSRFLINGTHSPFSWAARLQTYSKKVRDCTTSLGYISWSDDGQSVSYKDVQMLSITRFKEFVREQVQKTQEELEALLLVHPSESREDLGVAFRMHRIVDNAAENRNGWSFL